MKKTEQEQEQLTRSLMRETIEQPSAELNTRIMSFLFQNAQIRKVFKVKAPISAAQILGVFILYMLVIAGSLLLLRNQTGEVSELMVFLKDTFPIFLTVAGGVSFFILFGMLDEWLHQHEHKVSKK